MANFCSACGAAVSSDASFCSGYGQHLESVQPKQPPDDSPKPPKERRSLWREM